MQNPKTRGIAFTLLLSLACIGSSSTSDLDLWIGQMLMVGFRGTELEAQDPILQQIDKLNLGGVVLFDYDVPTRSSVRNILHLQQVRLLVNQLQERSRIPLLVAVDQEGGRITRLKPSHGFSPSLSAAELGRLDDEATTRSQARQTAHLLLDVGINLNLAPVLDLALNPSNPVISKLERSYGAEPERVIRHARWTLDEFRRAGLVAAVKHFPGHGSSREDSHLDLPDVTRFWSEAELQPFSELIGEGAVQVVMTAHLFHKGWDPDRPATLSPQVVEGMLRGDLEFEGVVISDDLGMGAIVDHYSFEQGIELALKAGIDVLLFGNNSTYNPEIATRAFTVVKHLVAQGTVSAGRIEQSFRRIQAVKERLGSH